VATIGVRSDLRLWLAGSSDMGDMGRAASQGDLGEVERLVGQDPSLLDARTLFDRTPLMEASEGVHLGVVRWLLDRGAAIDTQRDYGATALYMATWPDHLPVVRLLVERGADPTIALKNGFSLLMAACCASRGTEVARYLLAHPSTAAVINRRDDTGRTALWYACKYGRGPIVLLLLKHGADPTIAADNGETPMAIAHGACARAQDIEGQRAGVAALKVRGLSPCPRSSFG
jgi:uncharacterized protein